MPKLTREQHLELATLLNQAQDNITKAARIVHRAPYTDRALYTGGTVQEWLIDPLREVWINSGFGDGPAPYQSVAYITPTHRRKPAPKSPL